MKPQKRAQSLAKSMPTRIAAVALAAVFLAACQPPPAPSAAPPAASSTSGFDRAETLVLAAKARDACTTHMPDMRATRDAWTMAGLPQIGSDGRIWLHSPALADMLATTNTGAGAPFCAIAVRNMTESEANALIEPWIRAANAVPLAGAAPNFERVWEGRFAGGPVLLAIDDDFNIPGRIRGRTIIAGARR